MVSKIFMFLHRKSVGLYIRLAKVWNKEKRAYRHVNKLRLYYRICDKSRPKDKADFITKEKCFSNAISVFPVERVDWHIIADNVSEQTYEMLQKYIPKEQIQRVSVGSGSGTFRIAVLDAIQYDDNDLIYFLEDDYLHRVNSMQYLIEAAESNVADYLTLYDHPDKYGCNTDNPFVNGGENTFVFWCKHHHWKITNSTTMTFAAFVDTIKRDKKTYWRWTEKYLPSDFNMFIDLSLYKRAKLISPIPSLSTHGDKDVLAYGIDWSKV